MQKNSYTRSISAPSTSLASCIAIQCGDLESWPVMVSLIENPDCSVNNIDSSELLNSSFIMRDNGDKFNLTFNDDDASNSVATIDLNLFDQVQPIRTASMLEIKFKSLLKTRYANESSPGSQVACHNCDVKMIK